jgi:glycosyltransferase involved in cell wall biosynthesis
MKSSRISYLTGLGQGGAEKQVLETARLLTAKGHLVNLHVYNRDKAFYTVESDISVVDIRLNLRWLPEPLNKALCVFKLAWLIHRDRPDFFISYITLLNVLTGFAGLLNAFNPVTVFIGSERNSVLRYTRRTIWRPICRIFYHGLDGLFSNSREALNQLESILHINRKRIAYLPNLLNTDYFAPEYESYAGAQDGCKDRFTDHKPATILVPSRITEQKNQNILLDVAELLAKRSIAVHFILAGNNEGDYADDLRRQIEFRQLGDSVEMAGQIADIRAAYRAADLVLLPSLFEGLSNSLIEAMACESLVLVSQIPTFLELIREGENGFLFDPTNPISIADTIQAVLELDQPSRMKIAQQARLSVLQFGPEAYYQNLMGILEQMRDLAKRKKR